MPFYGKDTKISLLSTIKLLELQNASVEKKVSKLKARCLFLEKLLLVQTKKLNFITRSEQTFEQEINKRKKREFMVTSLWELIMAQFGKNMKNEKDHYWKDISGDEDDWEKKEKYSINLPPLDINEIEEESKKEEPSIITKEFEECSPISHDHVDSIQVTGSTVAPLLSILPEENKINDIDRGNKEEIDSIPPFFEGEFYRKNSDEDNEQVQNEYKIDNNPGSDDCIKEIIPGINIEDSTDNSRETMREMNNGSDEDDDDDIWFHEIMNLLWKRYHRATSLGNQEQSPKLRIFSSLKKFSNTFITGQEVNKETQKTLNEMERVYYNIYLETLYSDCQYRNPRKFVLVKMNQHSSFLIQTVEFLAELLNFVPLDIYSLPIIRGNPKRESDLESLKIERETRKNFKKLSDLRRLIKGSFLILVTYMGTDKWKQEIMNGDTYDNLEKEFKIFHFIIRTSDLSSPVPDYIKKNSYIFIVNTQNVRKKVLSSQLDRQKSAVQFFTSNAN